MHDLCYCINHNFDLRPGLIIKQLELKNPKYLKTACYGHFGRSEFKWEIPKKIIHQTLFAKSFSIRNTTIT